MKNWVKFLCCLLLPLFHVVNKAPSTVLGTLQNSSSYVLSSPRPGSITISPGPDLFNAKAFGAKGDGSTYDAPAIQACINAAARVRGTCKLPRSTGAYCVNGTVLNVPSLPVAIVGERAASVTNALGSTLSNCNNTRQLSGLIVADFHSGPQQAGFTVRNLQFIGGRSGAAGNNYYRGIILNNVSQALITHNRFTGFETNGTTGPQDVRVIDLENGVERSRIEDNYIIMLPRLVTDTVYEIPIMVKSPWSGQANGQAAGDPAPLPVTTHDILLTGNQITGGTHGINLQNTSHVTITHNRVNNNAHRNVIVFATNDHVRIEDNHLSNAGSVNILSFFGNSNVTVTKNTIDGTTGGEGYCVEFGYNSQDITIAGNRIVHCRASGINLAYSFRNATVSGNTIRDFGLVGKISGGVQILGTFPSYYVPLLAHPYDLDAVHIEGNTIKLTTVNTNMYGVYVLGKSSESLASDLNIDNVTVGSNRCQGVNTTTVFWSLNGSSKRVNVLVTPSSGRR